MVKCENCQLCVADWARAHHWGCEWTPSYFEPKGPLDHQHDISHVNGLQTALNNRSLVGHQHTISDVSSLQVELDGKLDTNVIDLGANFGIGPVVLSCAFAAWGERLLPSN